jgi:hypothetical protein
VNVCDLSCDNSGKAVLPSGHLQSVGLKSLFPRIQAGGAKPLAQQGDQKVGDIENCGAGRAVVAPAPVRTDSTLKTRRNRRIWCVQDSLTLRFEVRIFSFASLFQSARTNKLHDPSQFVFIEPGAMLFADINHHCRTAGKVDAVHQGFTNGAGNVAKVGFEMRRRWRIDGHTDNRRLLFFFGANLLEGGSIHPHPFTRGTFPQRTFAHLDRFHVRLAFRAEERSTRRHFGALRDRAAVRTELLANEHHPETR